MVRQKLTQFNCHPPCDLPFCFPCSAKTSDGTLLLSVESNVRKQSFVANIITTVFCLVSFTIVAFITAAKMADHTDGIAPKRSSLEEDDGCPFYQGATAASHLASQQSLLARGLATGMDVCDSGVCLTSFGCDLLPSFDVPEPYEAHTVDQQTCVSVGYTSFSGPEDALRVDSTLEGQMEGLSIACEPTTTTTSTTTKTAPRQSTDVLDQRKLLIDQLQLCFTPDVDGDT